MKVRIAFYKAKGNYVDKAIRIWTNSPYSHCEIVIDKNWYSSSPRDNGVRFKQIEPEIDSWDYVEVDINIDRLNKVYEEHKNQGYDYLGIALCMILPLGRNSKKKMFCSEFIAMVLGLDKPEMYSPDDLYVYLRKEIIWQI